MKNKKTLKIILLIICFTTLLIVVGLLFKNENKKSNKVNQIEYDKWSELVKKDKYTVTILAQTWCSHCEMIKPYIKQIENKYNIKIYWFYIDEMDKKIIEGIETDYNLAYKGTPHMFIIKNDKLVGELSGSRSKEEFIKFLKGKDVIK